MNLTTQKRLAASILKVGLNRVWIDPERMEEVSMAITREGVKQLINNGAIKAKPQKGISSYRSKKLAEQKKKGKTPLVDISLLKNQNLKTGMGIRLITNLSLAGALFAVSVFQQSVLHLSAFKTGLTLLPSTVGLLITSLLAPKLAMKFNHKIIMIIGFILAIGSTFLLKYQFGLNTHFIDIAPGLTVFGLGLGFVISLGVDISLNTTPEEKQAIENYIKQAASKSDLERTELNKDKTGVFTGSYAINPVNNEKIPIWISDYVLVTYGTGAIMAVPAHDQRDYEFATKFGLKIIPVLEGGDISKEAFVDDGVHINSDFLNGLNKEDSINKMISWLEEKNIGNKKINYKLREWIFARQRYWGEPIPVVYDENDKAYILPESDLPLVLPELEDYSPSKSGDSPLDKATNWVNTTFDGKNVKRETSTMPGSAGSSWYFLRYIDPKNDNEFANQELLKHWMPVDLYVGGPEHAVGHLLYSRFWNEYLFDKGLSPVKEPFAKLRHQGMILGTNGEKMSKSKGNVINPDDMVKEYGADSLRIYEMFMGPIDAAKPWDPNGIDGSKKFLEKVWRLYVESNKIQNSENKNLEREYHYTVKKVTNDYETMNFNTAISQMMIFINAVNKEDIFPTEYAEGFLKLLNPIAPHITEELWNLSLNHSGTISYEKWPTFDEEKTINNEITLPIQFNGKLKATIQISLDEDENSIKKKVHDAIESKLDGKTIIKEIYVKNKIYNIVIK